LLPNHKYHFVSEIHNDQSSSTIPDVAFNPSGCMFAVTYKDNNEVRIYDSSTQTLLRTYQNPEAQLDWPHGVVMTNRHIIVSNKHNPTNKPSTFTVYRVGGPSEKPITVFRTPVKHLREAHSLTVHNGRLLVTYCGKDIWARAIVSYRFDDEEGKISGPTSIIESWFAEHGEPKGVCFNEEGTKVIATFYAGKPTGFIYKIRRAKRMLREKGGPRKLIKIALSKFTKPYIGQKKKSDTGVVMFDVEENGELSNAPIQTLQGSQFSRPENITIVKDTYAIIDAVNDAVSLYNFDGDHLPDSPVQVIRDRLSFPHDACLSPDKKMLVVTNYGIDVDGDHPQWGRFIHPRSDKLTIYELTA